jgi:L-ascorbate metabolism protein UlaG (beta-lactamase superfamily)
MRFKPGRPDLTRYADLFDVPAATDGLSVTFLGVSSLLVDDGTSAILTDGFFSRPGMLQVLTRRLSPDAARIEACLARAGIDRLEAVVPVHGHFDHALDSAAVAARTGAVLVGGTSVANLGRGAGLAGNRIATPAPGTPTRFGPWTLTLVVSEHCPPDRYPG